MTDWPQFSDEDQIGRIGANLVALKIHKSLGWIFRETSSSDLGIDGEIEIRRGDRTSHGRLISVQIKCGPSYLNEQTSTGFIYRGSLKHLRYWSEYTTPVVVILCNAETESCWWVDVNLRYVRFHEKGWSIEVPFANELAPHTASSLETIANRLQKKDLIELLLRDWLGWSFEHRLRLASELAIPRDYHWLSSLGVIDDCFVMIDYVVSSVDGFDHDAVQEMLRWADYNHRTYGYDRFLLAFISESPDQLQRIPEPIQVPGVAVDYVPLLLDLSGQPSLTEIGKDGQRIEFYEGTEPWSDWANGQERNIKRTSP